MCGSAKKLRKKTIRRQHQECSEGTSSVAIELLIINCKICFINLFIFNCLTLNINLFNFNLFDVKFLFSENHIFRKSKRIADYRRASLVSDFKFTQENDGLLSSRHKQIFEVPHPVQEYIKMRIPAKGYQTNTVRTFWGYVECLRFEVPRFRPFW